MKNHCILLLLGLAASIGNAEEVVRYVTATAGSKVAIVGVHSADFWSMVAETNHIQGYFQAPESWFVNPSGDGGDRPVPQAEIRIPVARFKASFGPSELVREILDAKRHPALELRLRRLIPKADKFPPAGPWLFLAEAELTAAGRSHSYPLEIKLERIGNDQWRFSSRWALHMTDFGIDPPVLQVPFAVIRFEDIMMAGFEWTVIREQPVRLVRTLHLDDPQPTFGFSITGPVGARVRVDTSPDLIHWTALQEVVLVDGTAAVELDASSTPRGFFRARLLP